MRHLIRIMEPKVNIALEAARAGCKELLSFAYRLDQLEVKEKGPSNYVTQLDKRVESIIIDSLKSIYPKHTSVSYTHLTLPTILRV